MLARREHSRAELHLRLRAHGHDTQEIEAVIERLGEQGLQSDTRWAQALTRRRQAQGYGPLRIRAEIRARSGGAAGALADALSEPAPDDVPLGDVPLGDGPLDDALSEPALGDGALNDDAPTVAPPAPDIPSGDTQVDDALGRAVALLGHRFAGVDLRATLPRARALRLLINRGFPPAMALSAVERASRGQRVGDGQVAGRTAVPPLGPRGSG